MAAVYVLIVAFAISVAQAGYAGPALGHAGIAYAAAPGYAAPAYATHAAPAYAGIAAGPVAYTTGDHGHDVDYYAHPKYNYNYGVADGLTGDSKSQTEYRDGDVVKGSYSVAEPDGSIRVVHYTSDDVNGFNAVVSKIGPSHHPAKYAAPAVVAPALAVAAVPGHGFGGHYGHGILGGYAAYKHYPEDSLDDTEALTLILYKLSKKLTPDPYFIKLVNEIKTIIILGLTTILPKIYGEAPTIIDNPHYDSHYEPRHHNHGSQEVDYYSPPKYAFKYGVSDPHTGDHKTQTEIRDGEVVKGQYSLVEPDGSIRTVNYIADPVNGFNAVVSKSGPNVHVEPEQHLVPEKVVASPIPSYVNVKKLVPVPVPTYIKPIVPIVKHQPVAPAFVHYQKPIIKYTSAIGYAKPASNFYGDYDAGYAYPASYDLHDFYGDVHGHY